MGKTILAEVPAGGMADMGMAHSDSGIPLDTALDSEHGHRLAPGVAQHHGVAILRELRNPLEFDHLYGPALPP